jgi:hypothetical protein
MTKTAYDIIAAEAARIGWPQHWATDLTTHDRNFIDENQPRRFVWMLRTCGTDLVNEPRIFGMHTIAYHSVNSNPNSYRCYWVDLDCPAGRLHQLWPSGPKTFNRNETPTQYVDDAYRLLLENTGPVMLRKAVRVIGWRQVADVIRQGENGHTVADRARLTAERLQNPAPQAAWAWRLVREWFKDPWYGGFTFHGTAGDRSQDFDERFTGSHFDRFITDPIYGGNNDQHQQQRQLVPHYVG